MDQNLKGAESPVRLGVDSEFSSNIIMPAVAELAVRAAAAGPGRVSGAACDPGELGRVGRGPAQAAR
jgi:hypothetical protein